MKHRHIIAAGVPTLASTPAGRKRIAVIGIDRYRSWPALNNAVHDAKGALRLFEHLGFEPVGEPLLDDVATGAAIQALVTDELIALGPDDSLVLFFAGHGGTRRQWLGGEQLKTGYLIPADAAYGEKVATWIDLDDWLRKVARLPPRHILVILDACFAGIALTPVVKWRDSGTFQEASLASLQVRRSRRIITSALDDQVALDSGPVPDTHCSPGARSRASSMDGWATDAAWPPAQRSACTCNSGSGATPTHARRRTSERSNTTTAARW